MGKSNENKVELNKEEREYLMGLLDEANETHNQNLEKRIKILLYSDSGELGPNWTYKQIKNKINISEFTIWNIRKKYHEKDLDHAIRRKSAIKRRNALDVNLSKDERDHLESFLQQPQEHSSNFIKRVKILLYSDTGEFGPRMTYKEIENEIGVSDFTIWYTRNKYSEQGLDHAIYRKKAKKSNKSREIELTKKEREYLESILEESTEDSNINRLNRVKILLKSDRGEFGPNWTYEQINNEVGVSNVTIWKVRKQYHEEGLEDVLER